MCFCNNKKICSTIFLLMRRCIPRNEHYLFMVTAMQAVDGTAVTQTQAGLQKNYVT